MRNITSLLFIILGLSFLSCKTQNKAEDKPNFIIFIADDAAWNDAGAYGNKSIRTPNIDKLATEGLRFDNAFLTISSCSPSRSSIMTGLYPHNTGAGELHLPLPEDKLIFPGELKKLGYYTASAGKWHLGPNRTEFDTIVGGHPSGCEHWLKITQDRPKNKPFFFWFAANDPHRDYEPNIIPEPHDPATVVVPPFLPDADSTRKDLALYYDEIHRLDSYLGKVMDELKKQGVDENTMVIYMTDNGRPFPRCKTRVNDAGIKTPFIVRWPNKVEAGKTTESLISSIDIAPTLLELADGNIPEVFQGTSFAPILKNVQSTTRDYIIGEHNWHDYQAHERGVRTMDFLYIYNAFPELNASPPADAVGSITYQEMLKLREEGKLNEKQMDCFVVPRAQEELYDVNNDPYQFNNVISDPNYADALEKMRKLFEEWKQETNDKVPSSPTPDKFDRWTGKRLMMN